MDAGRRRTQDRTGKVGSPNWGLPAASLALARGANVKDPGLWGATGESKKS